MKLRLPTLRRRTGAFSLLEMMIAVGMLTIVVFALYSMFDQTQKALRQSLNQAELSEGGRAALDLIVRSVERAASPQVEDALHFVIKPADATGYELVFQGDGQQASRTQPLRFDELFFTYPIPGNLWHVAGLFVGPDGAGPVSTGPTVGIATLYLIDEALPNTNLVRILDDQLGISSGSDPAQVSPMRLTGPPAVQTNLITSRIGTIAFAGRETSQSRADAVRLLEGIIQFKVTAYDADGRPFDRLHPITYNLNAPRVGVDTNLPTYRPVIPSNWQSDSRIGGVGPSRPLPVSIVNINPDTSQVNAQFRGTNTPSALEIELTLLDGKQLDQFRSLPNTLQVRNRWLANNAGALQTLRQRVALRTAPQ